MKDEVPPRTDSYGETPSWVDSLAEKEEKNWPYEEKLKAVQFENDIRWYQWYGWIVVVLMIVFVVLFLSSLIILVIHYITPVDFLSEEKLGKIQSIIFSGTIGAIVTGILQKQIDKTR